MARAVPLIQSTALRVSAICLPPEPELRAEALRSRLGRSPGKGDAMVMCLSEGNAAQRKLLRAHQRQQAIANMGYAALKRAR